MQGFISNPQTLDSIIERFKPKKPEPPQPSAQDLMMKQFLE
jgi:hypothetical protein